MAAIDYLNKIRELKRPEYTSQFGGIISDLMGKIVNRQPFSYDFNADPIFHQYKDYYTKTGKEATMNAVANASALTGGYGNSYAATAGAQAGQQALSGLNDIIPALYNAAQKKYDTDVNALYADYDLYNNAENQAYGRYRDDLNDYENERGYLTGMYNTALAQENYEREQAAAQAEADRAYALQLAKLNSKGGSGSGSSKLPTGTVNPLTISTLAGAVASTIGAKNVKAPQNAQNTQNTEYRDAALTQQAINVYRGSKDITQVENLLQSQVNKGKLTENEAVDLLDDIIKKLR